MIQQQVQGGSFLATAKRLSSPTSHIVTASSSASSSSSSSSRSPPLYRNLHTIAGIETWLPEAEKSYFKRLSTAFKQVGFVASRGLFGTACRDAIYVSGMLAVTPRLQRFLSEDERGPALSTSSASVCASALGFECLVFLLT